MKIKKLSIVLEIIILLCLTLFLIFDYFPQAPFTQFISPKKIFWIIISILVLSMIIFRKNSDDGNMSFKYSLILNGYFIFLIGLLTLLGGQSSTGISFSNYEFWIIFIIALVDIWGTYKKTKNPSFAKFISATLLLTIVIISLQFWKHP